MKTIYKGDSRYEKIKEQMDLLGITDVTTERQVLNGTIVWQLPIKSRYDSTRYLQYGSFASGYVRNQGVECHSNYQINKRVMSDYEYYPDYKWCDKAQKSIKTGKFNRFKSKRCVPIPIEIDRLEYMMKYIIKNEFIKRASYDCITRVEHINSMQATESYYKDKLNLAKQNVEFHEARANEYRNTINDVTVIIDGHKYKLQ